MPIILSAPDSSCADRNWGWTVLLSAVECRGPCAVWRVVCHVFVLVDVGRLDVCCCPVEYLRWGTGRVDTVLVEIEWLVRMRLGYVVVGVVGGLCRRCLSCYV